MQGELTTPQSVVVYCPTMLSVYFGQSMLTKKGWDLISSTPATPAPSRSTGLYWSNYAGQNKTKQKDYFNKHNAGTLSSLIIWFQPTLCGTLGYFWLEIKRRWNIMIETSHTSRDEPYVSPAPEEIWPPLKQTRGC